MVKRFEITVIPLNRLLQHPNSVQLLGYTLSDTELILVMNLVEGHNLHKLLFGKLLIKVHIPLFSSSK